MVELSQTMPPFPLTTDDQANALQIAGAYPSFVSKQTATSLLGCPPLTGVTTPLANITTSLLTGVSRGAGLVALSDLWAET